MDICLNNVIDLGIFYKLYLNNERVSINYKESNVEILQDYDKYTINKLTKIEIETVE